MRSTLAASWWGQPQYAYRGTGVAYAFMVVVAFAGGEAMYRVPASPRSSGNSWVLAATVTIMAAILVTQAIRKRRVRSRVRAAGGCVCTECGYNLVGLAEQGKCPECGVPYVMADVRAAWAAWVGGE